MNRLIKYILCLGMAMAGLLLSFADSALPLSEQDEKELNETVAKFFKSLEEACYKGDEKTLTKLDTYSGGKLKSTLYDKGLMVEYHILGKAQKDKKIKNILSVPVDCRILDRQTRQLQKHQKVTCILIHDKGYWALEGLKGLPGETSNEWTVHAQAEMMRLTTAINRRDIIGASNLIQNEREIHNEQSARKRLNDHQLGWIIDVIKNKGQSTYKTLEIGKPGEFKMTASIHVTYRSGATNEVYYLLYDHAKLAKGISREEFNHDFLDLPNRKEIRERFPKMSDQEVEDFYRRVNKL